MYSHNENMTKRFDDLFDTDGKMRIVDGMRYYKKPIPKTTWRAVSSN